MAANSDIIKIGFDYETGLQEFLKDYDGTMNKVQKSADGKRVEIQFDVSDKDVIKKISALQSELKNVKIELNGKTLDQQFDSIESIRKKLLEIVDLVNKGVNIDSLISVDNVGNRVDKLGEKIKTAQDKIDKSVQHSIDKYSQLRSEIEALENAYNKIERNKYEEKDPSYMKGRFSNDYIDLSEYNDIDATKENFDYLGSKLKEIYSLYQKMQSAINDNNGWLNGQQYDDNDLKNLIGDFKALAQAYHELDPEKYNKNIKEISDIIGSSYNSSTEKVKSLKQITGRMSEEFKGYVSDIINDSNSVKENNKIFDQEVKNLQERNKQAVEFYNSLKEKLLSKISDKNQRNRLDNLLPDVPDNFNFQFEKFGEDILGNKINIFEEFTKVLGIEIPQAAEKANASLNDIATNDSGSKKEIENQNELQNELKETEIQAEKTEKAIEDLKTPSSETNISSGKNTPSEGLGASADASVKDVKAESDALDATKQAAEGAAKAKEKFVEANKNVKQSADASVGAVKDEADALEKVETFTPNTSGFDEILKKLNLTKSELVDIVKITKQSVADSDGKFHTSYTLKDSRGSTETYGESSKTDKGQLLRSNIVSFDAKEAAKAEVKNREEALNQMRLEEADYLNERERLLNEGKQQAKEAADIETKERQAALDQMRIDEANYESERQRLLDEGKTQAKEAADAELQERKKVLNQMRLEEADYLNERERLLNEGKQQAKEAADIEKQSENKYYSDWSDAESINKTMDESTGKIKKAKSEMLKLDLPSRLQDDFDELNKRIDELNKRLVKGDIGFGAYGDYVSNYVKAFSDKVKATASSDKADKKQSTNANDKYYSDWSNAEKINNSLIKTSQLLDELKKKTPDHLKMDFDNVEQSVKGLNAQLTNGDKSVAAYDKAVQSVVDKFSKQIDNQKKSLETQLSSLINETDKNVKAREAKPKDYDQSEQYVNAIKEYKAQLAELRVFAEEISNTEVVSSEQLKRFDDLKKKVNDSAQSFKNLSAAEKGSTALSRDKLYNKIGDYLEKNSGMAKNFKDQLKALQNQLKDRGPNANVSDLTDQFVKLQAQIREAGQEGKSFWSIIKEKAFYGLASQIGMYFGLNDFIRYAQEGVNVVRELDTAFTEMQKVSDETAASLKNYQKTTFDTADAVGTTAMQIQNSTADWMRLGESLDEASKSAKTSNILLNVSEFDNIEDATKSLVSMSQAYKDLDKLTIVDKLNEVGKFVAQTYSNVWCYKVI